MRLGAELARCVVLLGLAALFCVLCLIIQSNEEMKAVEAHKFVAIKHLITENKANDLAVEDE